MRERAFQQGTDGVQNFAMNANNARWFDEELYAGLWDDGAASPDTLAQPRVAGSLKNVVDSQCVAQDLCASVNGQARQQQRPLRIVHVCKFFPPERGGMETYVRDLAQEQAAAGHEVTVLSHTASASRRERMPEGYAVSRSRVWMRAGDYAPVAPGLAGEVWRVLRGGKLDILHLHCPNPASLWCVLLWGKAGCAGQDLCGADVPVARMTRGPRLVVHWHADVIFPLEKQPNAMALQLWRRLERGLLARADRIIATSQPYLDSSEFLAPWRGKCVVAPLRLSTKRPAVPSGLRHPALDFLRGTVASGQGDESIMHGQTQQNGRHATAGDVLAGEVSQDAGQGDEGIIHEQAQQDGRHATAGDVLAGEVSQDAGLGDEGVGDATQGEAARTSDCAMNFGAGGTTRAVLAVGRLAHYKGFEVLVRAIALEPSLRCCIIGEGEEGPKLRALVQELGVQDRVLLPGEVDDATLAACYEACDVFCLPSLLRTEAFGVVLLEALRAGKWCVASNVPGSGMGTVVQHGVNGWLVPPGDAAELGRGLERTLNFPHSQLTA